MINNFFRNKKINLGIEVLRLILLFWVVIIHCSNIKKEHEKYLKKHFHVPTFILLSFYFFYNAFTQRIIIRIIARFERLLIPYIIWPIFLLIINIFSIIISSSSSKISLILSVLRDFYIQLLIGSRIHGILWYQFNLIFLSLFFTLISFIFKSIVLKVITFLGFTSFYLHISGWNYNFFIRYKGIYGMNMGCLLELMPLAIIGCVFGSQKLLSKIKYISIYSRFLLFLSIFLYFQYDIFKIQSGFRYPNVSLNMLASTSIFIFFGTLCLEEILNEKYIFILNNITKFTGGIYYTHPIIRNFLRNYIIFFKTRTYSVSLIIYIICYFFCFLGNYLFKNNKLKYLFF